MPLACRPGTVRARADRRTPIQTLGLLDETFEPRAWPREPFADSLGADTGSPKRVVVEFTPDAAAYRRERTWHRSQHIEDTGDSGITLTLTGCNGRPLLA